MIDTNPGAVLKDIGAFDKQSLQHVKTAEKVVLPDKEVINKEKTERKIMDEIISKPDLKHTTTEEKIALPTKEDIEAEKAQK